MPNVESAKKRNRQNVKRNAYNTAMKSKVKTIEKKILSLVTSNNLPEAKNELNLYFQAVDKAVVRGVIKKNTGARKKSNFSKKLYTPKK